MLYVRMYACTQDVELLCVTQCHSYVVSLYILQEGSPELKVGFLCQLLLPVMMLSHSLKLSYHKLWMVVLPFVNLGQCGKTVKILEGWLLSLKI